MFHAPPPERRRRGDLVAAAVLVVVLAAAAVLVAATSDVAGTTSRVAAEPIAAPPPATGAPTAFVEAWRAPSAVTRAPVVAGPAAVTAQDGTVTGRDPRTGEERWSYARDLPLCDVGSGFPAQLSDGTDAGHVLALYGDGPLDAPGTWCSELTMLTGSTGAREESRNPDARPGTRLVPDDTYVLSTGTDHLEAWRYDLVRTVEYGVVPAQEQAGRQPRPDCTYGSAAQGGRRTAVVERCPGEQTDRLTVLVTDGKDGAEEPEVVHSTPLPGRGAVVVAVGTERTAVALPDPDRIVVYDAGGTPLGATELDIAPGDLAADPAGGVSVTTADDRYRYWWTGSAVVALDAAELAPVWTLAFALGPPVRYGTDLVVPVREGLRVVDAARGEPGRTLPLTRDDPAAPVALAVQGEVLLEQRGAEVVGLVPG
ncbi:MAG: hypothetical protein NTW05_24265 [Pseudonocardiales bacterium]|nr:hypothetical protein [Pseudonocardiales bacterium]